jgi:hypothetical protein
MHTAIIVIKMPELLPHEKISQQWLDFVSDVNALRNTKPQYLDKQPGVARLAENVWQVNIKENPGAFARLLYFASQRQLRYGILQLDAAPQWLPGDFDPNSTTDHNDGSWESPDDD